MEALIILGILLLGWVAMCISNSFERAQISRLDREIVEGYEKIIKSWRDRYESIVAEVSRLRQKEHDRWGWHVRTEIPIYRVRAVKPAIRYLGNIQGGR
jgi:hypothetical protein